MIRRAAAVLVLSVAGYAAILAVIVLGYAVTGEWTDPKLGGQGYWDWAGILTVTTRAAAVVAAAGALVAGAFWAVGALDTPRPKGGRIDKRRLAALERAARRARGD